MKGVLPIGVLGFGLLVASSLVGPSTKFRPPVDARARGLPIL